MDSYLLDHQGSPTYAYSWITLVGGTRMGRRQFPTASHHKVHCSFQRAAQHRTVWPLCLAHPCQCTFKRLSSFTVLSSYSSVHTCKFSTSVGCTSGWRLRARLVLTDGARWTSQESSDQYTVPPGRHGHTCTFHILTDTASEFLIFASLSTDGTLYLDNFYLVLFSFPQEKLRLREIHKFMWPRVLWR